MAFLFLLALLSVATAKEPEKPKDSLEISGKASFYHDDFVGLRTSNGESYNANDFTAAHLTFPFNTLLLVTNKKNNKSVVVRVNDRGPFRKSRVIDLSRSAAVKVGMIPFGVVPVRIEVLNFFDRFQIKEERLEQGDIYNCFSKKIDLDKETIYIWQSKHWKHAFYMASALALEHGNENICVRISGPPHKRYYQVLMTGIENKKLLTKWLSTWRKDGFTLARPFAE